MNPALSSAKKHYEVRKGGVKPPKIGMLSLGCPRNLVDSEKILGLLGEAGYRIYPGIEGVDAAIINTCSFIKDAVEESIDIILELVELKKSGDLRSLIVTGCLPQRFKEDLASDLKEVDAFVGIGNYNRIAEVVDTTLKGKRCSLLSPRPQFNFLEAKRFSLTPTHYAYIKISEGCQNDCSYCIIPSLKGRYVSHPLKSVIEEVETLPGEVSEIILLGQDTTLYGADLNTDLNLAKLLVKLNEIRRKGWIRVLYSHPAHFSDELTAVIKNAPSVCRYVDLPLEHINDNILRRMNRGIEKRRIISLIEKLRKEIPGLTIRTSFIVGFPGETEENFQELLDFIREYKFEHLGAFIYSPEEGTRAFNYTPQVSPAEKEERFKKLLSLQKEISQEVNRDLLGRELDILIDEQDTEDKQLFIGRSEGDAPEVDGQVYVKAKNVNRGDFIKVRITDTLEYDLVGEKVL